MSETRHPCPCCGYRTYAAAAGGTMQICPVCGWEDSPWDYGSNEIPLPVAQRNFKATGACEEDFLSLVRPPAMGEDRPSGWVPFDESCHAIIKFIEKSFRDVNSKNATPLRHAFDDCTPPDEVEQLLAIQARKRWQNIPRPDIETHGMSLLCLDPAGVRFHLPAFMRASLQLWQESPFADFLESDLLIYGLNQGPRDFQLLDHPQHQAAAAYLQFVAHSTSRESDARDAHKGLEKGWQEYLPNFIPFPSLPS